MKIDRIRGIVIKERVTGEANKQLVILAKGYGKMVLGAGGAKNQKSKFLASAQLFAYSDFEVYENRGFLNLKQGNLIESFYPIRQDLLKLSYSVYLLEFLEKTVPEGLESDSALELLLKTLSVLSKTNFPVLLAVCIFELKYLQLMGLMPEMEVCCLCGQEKNTSALFSSRSGGVVCDQCKQKVHDVHLLSKGTNQAMNYILSTEKKQLFHFRVSDAVLQELVLILKEYIKIHINETFPTRSFAEKLN